MPKYRLTPINPDDPCWQGVRPEPVEVEVPACDDPEQVARALARIRQGTGYKKPGTPLHSPWTDASKTTVELVDAE